MSKHIVKGYVYMAHGYLPDYSDKAWKPDIRTYKAPDNKERIYISEIAIDVSIPDDFDPVPQQVAAIEKEKREVLAAYTARVAQLNEELSKLQAISYTQEAA